MKQEPVPVVPETIVPESLDHPYNRRLTMILENEGILCAHRVNPFMNGIQGIAQDVEEYMNTAEGKKSFRRPWQETRAQRRNRLVDDRAWENQEEHLRDKYREFYIHMDKLPLPLRNNLAGQQDEGGFIRAKEGFMTFYMTLLANKICQKHDMSLLTNAVSYNNLSNRVFRDSFAIVQGDFENDQVRRGVMYQIIMDDIKIAPSISIEEIIQFRRERQQELARFREEMDKLTGFDTEGMNAQDFEHEMKRIYNQEIIPAMNNVKTTLDEARINWLSGPAACVFSGIIPLTLSLDLSTTSGIISGVSQGIALTLTSLPIIRNWQARRSPYAYLIKMKQEISIAGKS